MVSNISDKLLAFKKALEQEDINQLENLSLSIEKILDLNSVDEQNLEYLQMKIKFYGIKGDMRGKLETINLLLSITDRSENLPLRNIILEEKVGVLINLSKPTEALEVLYEIDTDNTDPNALSRHKSLKGKILLELGQYTDALDILQSVIEDFKRIKDDEALINTYNIIARIHYVRGHINLAKETMELALEVANRQESLYYSAMIITNLGSITHSIGEMNQSLAYYTQGLAIWEKLGNTRNIIMTKSNLSILYEQAGEINKAIELINETIDNSEELGSIDHCVNSFASLGNLYKTLGNFELAEYYILRSKEYADQLDDPIKKKMVYLSLISLYKEIDKPEQVSRFYSEFKMLPLFPEIPRDKQISILVDVQMLLSKGRRRDLGKAEELLREVLELEILDISYHERAVKILCNMLLDELGSSFDEDILDEIIVLIKKLRDYASKLNSYRILSESFFIQSMLVLLLDTNNFNESMDLLLKAESIAEEYALQGIMRRISHQKEILSKNQSIWENLSSMSANERLLIVKHGKYLETVQESLNNLSVYEIDIPQLLLIQDESGIVKFSHTFKAMKDAEIHLISSFIAALNSFSKEIFSTNKSLEIIQHQEYTIAFAQKQQLLFSYIYNGKSNIAASKLEEFISLVKHEFSEIFEWKDELSDYSFKIPEDKINRIFL
ncbi:MAG: tetratricopeptide repeat protein [Candidatus Heimdallarchaeota archaeon]|nr:tetratricopeptide repeat protein [Candidatus Heimdallarchaeota archaeon]